MITTPQTLFAAALAIAASSAALAQPELRIDRDNIEIRESVFIPAGDYRVTDADGNGVLQIAADDVTVEFAPGARLIGSAHGQDPDEYTGIGVGAHGVQNVTIRGGVIRGFKVGLFTTNTDGLTVENVRFEDNFRQHLGSTPEAEDSSDWLWPHANENNEWMNNYGAAMYVESAEDITVRRVTVRDGQNGIIIDSVNDSKIYDNDCSFLSGWGLAMWRSNRNVISRNALDFCIRGYSHGVYNRGQDSAGILMFEQNNDNVIAENSATHGGDGFFGFAGREALGQIPSPDPDFDVKRKGNNDNLLINNDFSYAAAHGIEMTFSFGNRFIGNRLVENAICGVWGGYSDLTLIAGNEFIGNGEGAYGMERGGVNIEHGQGNRIEWNTFKDNKCGVYLWWDPDEGLTSTPWAKINGVGSEDNSIIHNRFTGDLLAIQLRKTDDTVVVGNTFTEVDDKIDADDESNIISDVLLPAVVFTPPEYPVYGENRPVGARSYLEGRQNIIMTEWGPWDHRSPLMRKIQGETGSPVHIWALEGAPPIEAIKPIYPDQETLTAWGVEWGRFHPEMPEERINVGSPEGPGLFAYRIRIKAGDWEGEISDQFLIADWTVRVFPWETDPRNDLDGWHEEAMSDRAQIARADSIDFKYGGGGPANIEAIAGDIDETRIGADHFGTIATTELPLDAGRYRITTISDDGIRVTVDDERVIDNWTWHPPTRNTGEFTVARDRTVEIRIEHFEIDGFAQLQFEIERVMDGAGG